MANETDDSQPHPAAAPDSDRARRRAARRAALGRKIDTSVPSPCIAVCQIDDASGQCLGCHRTIDEIRDWIIMTAEEKRALLDKLATRQAAVEP
jgi:predicted Fe-S protein YdhL (DUF1289 family)